ncbi:MAG: hypothetical protein ACKO85_11210 [Isosphaeraceae bacterium]
MPQFVDGAGRSFYDRIFHYRLLAQPALHRRRESGKNNFPAAG